jgi:hypothetical protein
VDPIHPIIPLTPGIGAIAPLTRTRRIDPKAQREPGRDPRGKYSDQHADEGEHPDEGDTTPHVDVTT